MCRKENDVLVVAMMLWMSNAHKRIEWISHEKTFSITYREDSQISKLVLNCLENFFKRTTLALVQSSLFAMFKFSITFLHHAVKGGTLSYRCLDLFW